MIKANIIIIKIQDIKNVFNGVNGLIQYLSNWSIICHNIVMLEIITENPFNQKIS